MNLINKVARFLSLSGGRIGGAAPGEHEIASFPATSEWAQKCSCGAQTKLEPRVTEELVRLMLSVKSGKLQRMAR